MRICQALGRLDELDALLRPARASSYDLTFSEGPGGEHSTTVNGEGREPSSEDCLAIADGAGISHRDAMAVFEDVNAGIARWDELADEACCPRDARRTIAERLERL